MTAPSKQTLSIHFDGQHWLATDNQKNMMTLSVADNESLPTLPDTGIVHTLLLPAEQLLHRTFQLPFAQPKFIDQDILSQELEERGSGNNESWWLSWQAGKHADGVSGIMFGMPESMRQHIEANESWQHTTFVGSDIWLRLNAQLEQHLNHQPDTNQSDINQSGSAVAVFDTDSSGMFFGLWQPSDEQNKAGLWQAMRRLNWPDAGQPCSSLIEDIKRSLLSMGWHDDLAIATGCLAPQLHAALGFSTWQGQLCDADALLSRPDATMAASAATTKPKSTPLNFRHGRWRSGSHFNQLAPWYRSMAWAATLMLLWTANILWQNHQLQTQLLEQQQAIIEAFHAGLPDEPVIIDALAQLRKAAGGNTLGSESNKRSSSSQWLHYIENINQVYQQTPWTIKTLSLQQGIMSMSGQTSDLQHMNRLQKALQQQSGLDIQVQDTDLSQNQVRFKMVWP